MKITLDFAKPNHVRIARALSDPTRFRVCQNLKKGPMTGTELAGKIKMRLPAVSYAVRCLYRDRIVVVHEEKGSSRYYKLNPKIFG